MVQSTYYRIGVIGSGRMGADIVDYLSDYNFPLTWICVSEEEKEIIGKIYLKKLERRHRNGLVDDELFQFRKDNSVISCSLRECAGCDIIIEAIHEDTGAKSALFRELETHVRGDAVIVSNSSSIKPSRLIEHAVKKERFAGLHFFYPVRYKNIAELIHTDYTSDDTLQLLRQFLSIMGKFHIEMDDRDAFILNKIFLDCQAQACRFCDDDVFSLREMDGIIKRSLFPMGVFEFFDRVGLDVVYESVVNYAEDSPDPEFYAPLIRNLNALISKKRLGKKSGAGFYDYPERDFSIRKQPESPPLGDALSLSKWGLGDRPASRAELLLTGLYVNAAFKALERGICSRGDLEYAIMEYMGITKGPFTYADEIGTRDLCAILAEYHGNTGFAAYHPSQLMRNIESRSCSPKKTGGAAG